MYSDDSTTVCKTGMYIGVNLDLPGMNIDEYFQNNNQIIEIWVVAYFNLN